MTQTPKEKAVELVEKFGNIQLGVDELDRHICGNDIEGETFHKQCALIAVEECMLACSAVGVIIDKRLNDKTFSKSIIEDSAFLFWQQVKEEIEKQ